MLSTPFIRRCLRLSARYLAEAPWLVAVGSILLLSSVVLLPAPVTAFRVALNGSSAGVAWEVNTEADVTGFDLARKDAPDPAYAPLSSVVPTGQRRYLFTDRNVYGGATGAGPFTYRLTVRSGTANPEQTYTATLDPTPSAIQRSWDTIKSMFR